MQWLIHCLVPRLLLSLSHVTEGIAFSMQYAEGEGSGDLGPLHMNVWNTIIQSVMCKAHTGDAYCIAAAIANTKLLELFV